MACATCSLAVGSLLGLACQAPPRERVGQASLALTHSFDLAANLPPHLSIMFAMSWFGLKSTEPSLSNPDPSYGNWSWSTPSCGGIASDPHECALFGASYERNVASRGRPLAGIYSSSGADEESRRRIDLMLSTIRRPCDEGARIDAFAIQLNGLRNTSLHPSNPAATSAELPYQALRQFLARADAAGMHDAVMPAIDATWYWHFQSAAGLDCDGDPQSCADQLSADIVDLLALVGGHPSALRVGGRPMFLFYEDAGTIPPSAWVGIFDRARNDGAEDFYTLGSKSSSAATADSLFDAFDALAPWIELGAWDPSTSEPVRSLAASYAQSIHQGALSAVSGHPGRVVFAGLHPGFNDFTEDWGACSERTIPHVGQGAGPRDLDFLEGMFDWAVATGGLQGALLATWDDWTEGSYFEPDLTDGPERLVRLRNRLGELYGEAADPPGESRLRNRWTDYGQARGCSDTTAIASPPGPGVPDLACGAGGGAGTGAGGGAQEGGASSGGGGAGASAGGSAPATGGGTAESGGCGCRTAPRHTDRGLALGALLGLAAVGTRRARSREGEPQR
jgi:MYXO-CTERM domain-containing protein